MRVFFSGGLLTQLHPSFALCAFHLKTSGYQAKEEVSTRKLYNGFGWEKALLCARKRHPRGNLRKTPVLGIVALSSVSVKKEW